MKKEALKRIFEFIEDKEGQNPPFMWKHMNDKSIAEEELNVKGDLNLWGRDIKSLPEGLKVEGFLNLEFSTIQTLPKGLEVGENLALSGCQQLTLLPERLKVGGTLYVQYSEISSLPKGLEVNGALFISNTELEKYTDEELREMIKPGFIKGKIYR